MTRCFGALLFSRTTGTFLPMQVADAPVSRIAEQLLIVVGLQGGTVETDWI